MEKVTVVHKGGRTQTMDARYAKVLIKMGRVTLYEEPAPKPKRVYKRRDMTAETSPEVTGEE